VPTEELRQAIDEPTQEELNQSYNKVSTYMRVHDNAKEFLVPTAPP
jgi:hypothetical protein